MTTDITGYGSAVSLVASNTYPIGITVTEFADDVDPLDIASVKIADTAMGVNGDLQKWTRAVGKPVTLSVIPGSLDDINLTQLAQNNSAVQGKTNANDVITITVVYPDGTTCIFANGYITDAPFGKSIASSGRLKTRTFGFVFESVNGA